MPALPWSSGGQTFRALRHRNFRLLWFGQAGQSASLWMDQAARAVLILDLTGSALALSLVIAARLTPTLLFGLIAGAIADRTNRKKLLLGAQFVRFGSHLFLGVMVTTGLIETWHVYASALSVGFAQTFDQPVRQSLIPMLVPREDLLNAIALNSTVLSFMRIGGGVLAGLLLIPFDPGGVYLITAAIFSTVLVTTMAMRLPETKSTRPRKSLLGDVKEGFVYIGQNRHLALVTGLALILFLFGFPYQQVFTPLLATQVLGMGGSGVGFLAGATGVGAVAGSLFVAARGVRRPGLQLMFNMLVFGGALVALSLQATIIGTMLLLALAGSMTVTYMAFTNSILLEHSDPEMHGRVMSLLSLDRGLIPLGAIAAGILAETLGVRPGLFIMGAIVLGLSALALLFGGRRLAAIRSGENLSERNQPASSNVKEAAAG
jgi:MFS family permease